MRKVFVTVLALLAVSSAVWAISSEETSSQLFLAPSAVPEAIYAPINLATPGSTIFDASQVPGGTVINNVAVLPVLLANPTNPVDGSYTAAQLDAINFSNYVTYFALTPTVDYAASTPVGGSDTVTFNRPGVYYVQLQTDAGDGIFQVCVETALAGNTLPTAAGAQLPGPPNDGTTIISAGDPGDPVHLPDGNITPGAMVNAQQQLKNAQTATTVQGVVNDIAAESKLLGGKFEVYLVGHGYPGGIKIGTQYIDATGGDTLGGMTAKQFQKAIDAYASSIHFYSCSTAQGDFGSLFLVQMSESIGPASGYTCPIWISTEGFYADATGGRADTTGPGAIPEPATVMLFALGLFSIVFLRRASRYIVASF